MFAIISHFCTSLVFAGKTRSLPLEWNLAWDSTQVGSVLASVLLARATLSATISYFYLSLVFVGKTRSLPLEWNLVRGSTQVGSGLDSVLLAKLECQSLLPSLVFVGEARSLPLDRSPI
jgi:hypothetical protein